MGKTLELAMTKAANLPEATQEQLGRELLERIDALALQALSPDDHEALSRSAEDVRQWKFTIDDEVEALFDRYRRK